MGDLCLVCHMHAAGVKNIPSNTNRYSSEMREQSAKVHLWTFYDIDILCWNPPYFPFVPDSHPLEFIGFHI